MGQAGRETYYTEVTESDDGNLLDSCLFHDSLASLDESAEVAATAQVCNLPIDTAPPSSSSAPYMDSLYLQPTSAAFHALQISFPWMI